MAGSDDYSSGFGVIAEPYTTVTELKCELWPLSVTQLNLLTPQHLLLQKFAACRCEAWKHSLLAASCKYATCLASFLPVMMLNSNPCLMLASIF